MVPALPIRNDPFLNQDLKRVKLNVNKKSGLEIKLKTQIDQITHRHKRSVEIQPSKTDKGLRYDISHRLSCDPSKIGRSVTKLTTGNDA